MKNTSSVDRQGIPRGSGDTARETRARKQGQDSFDVHPQILGETVSPRKIPAGETQRPEQS